PYIAGATVTMDSPTTSFMIGVSPSSSSSPVSYVTVAVTFNSPSWSSPIVRTPSSSIDVPDETVVVPVPTTSHTTVRFTSSLLRTNAFSWCFLPCLIDRITGSTITCVTGAMSPDTNATALAKRDTDNTCHT